MMSPTSSSFLLSMASLQSTLLTSSSSYCCSCVLLHPRTTKSFLKTKKISLYSTKWRFSTAKSVSRGEFLAKGGILAGKMAGRSRVGVAGAGKGPFFSGGGGRLDKGMTSRLVGNLAFAGLLTYLAMTGQLRWVLDAIISFWLLVVLLPILGFGALFFFAGQDILRSSCPNCGNGFQILKSSLKDGPQLCPYCTQPFSVQGNKFVRASARFSSGRSATNAQAFNEFSHRVEKGKATSGTVVDIEAEVKDIE